MSGGRVFADVSRSLDGFITGPNDSVEKPLGEEAIDFTSGSTTKHAGGARAARKAVSRAPTTT